jgi:hypothetical protein
MPDTKPTEPVAVDDWAKATTTVKLPKPITMDGQTLTELTLRQPCTGDLRGMSLAAWETVDTEVVLNLTERVCLTPLLPGSLDSMHPANVFALARAFGPFLRG